MTSLLQHIERAERWLPVLGYKGFYEVSDLGRVRSVNRIVVSKRGIRAPRKGKLLKPTFNRSSRDDIGGRWQVRLTHDGKPRAFFVHVLVLEAFVSARPIDMECCHNNGDHHDNRLSNLRWGTKSDNAQDRIRHGTHYEIHKWGGPHPNSLKTHCKNKHPLSGDNLYSYKGKRDCVACRRQSQRQYRSRKLAAS